MSKLVGILALAGVAASANAGFSLGGTGPFDSAGPLGNAGNFSQIVGGVPGNHLIGSVRLRGTLTEVNLSTFASEARWNVANLTAGYNNNYQGSTVTSFTGSIDIDRTFGVLQWWNNGDQLRLEAFESFDDSGVDARWTNIQFDFNDAAIINLGDFAQSPTWQFDTAGSNYDTELAVYTANGTLVANDDDSGPGVTSQINTGALADGIYYIVVGGFDSVFANGSAVGGNAAGNHILNINGAGVGSGSAVAGQLIVYQIRIPTPGALALLGMGAVVAGRRRR